MAGDEEPTLLRRGLPFAVGFAAALLVAKWWSLRARPEAAVAPNPSASVAAAASGSNAQPGGDVGARDSSYRTLGALDDRVLSRLAPPIYELADGGRRILAWPGSALGALRVIERKDSSLLVTDGLSDPWSAALWRADRKDEAPLAFELAFEMTPGSGSMEQVNAATWATWLLYRLGDQLSFDQDDFAARVARFGAITYRIEVPSELPVERLESGETPLLIAPFRTSESGEPVVLLVGSRKVSLLAVRLLRIDEYKWAVAGGNETSLALDRAFHRRHAHAVTNWTSPLPAPRASVLPNAQRENDGNAVRRAP